MWSACVTWRALATSDVQPLHDGQERGEYEEGVGDLVRIRGLAKRKPSSREMKSGEVNSSMLVKIKARGQAWLIGSRQRQHYHHELRSTCASLW